MACAEKYKWAETEEEAVKIHLRLCVTMFEACVLRFYRSTSLMAPADRDSKRKSIIENQLKDFKGVDVSFLAHPMISSIAA